MTANLENSLRDELDARLTRAREEGIVDVKATFGLDADLLVPHQLVVLNNILRMREEGVAPTFSS